MQASDPSALRRLISEKDEHGMTAITLASSLGPSGSAVLALLKDLVGARWARLKGGEGGFDEEREGSGRRAARAKRAEAASRLRVARRMGATGKAGPLVRRQNHHTPAKATLPKQRNDKKKEEEEEEEEMAIEPLGAEVAPPKAKAVAVAAGDPSFSLFSLDDALDTGLDSETEGSMDSDCSSDLEFTSHVVLEKDGEKWALVSGRAGKKK
jgi:hypothetical protein